MAILDVKSRPTVVKNKPPYPPVGSGYPASLPRDYSNKLCHIDRTHVWAYTGTRYMAHDTIEHAALGLKQHT